MWTTQALAPQWNEATVDLGEQPWGYKIAITGRPASFSKSNIAIDDVSYVDCDPNKIYTEKSLNCTFEKDLCDYYHDKGDFKWIRDNKTPSSGTGPGGDHTTGKGKISR